MVLYHLWQLFSFPTCLMPTTVTYFVEIWHVFSILYMKDFAYVFPMMNVPSSQCHAHEFLMSCYQVPDYVLPMIYSHFFHGPSPMLFIHIPNGVPLLPPIVYIAIDFLYFGTSKSPNMFNIVFNVSLICILLVYTNHFEGLRFLSWMLT